MRTTEARSVIPMVSVIMAVHNGEQFVREATTASSTELGDSRTDRVTMPARQHASDPGRLRRSPHAI
jgi:hypothetical protein